jgi:hypothetical protein
METNRHRLLKIPEDRGPEEGSSCGSASCQQRKTRLTQNILLEPSSYPEAVYAIKESRTKQGILHAFGRDSRLDEAHTVHRPRNCREMTTVVCYGPIYRH